MPGGCCSPSACSSVVSTAISVRITWSSTWEVRSYEASVCSDNRLAWTFYRNFTVLDKTRGISDRNFSADRNITLIHLLHPNLSALKRDSDREPHS